MSESRRDIPYFRNWFVAKRSISLDAHLILDFYIVRERKHQQIHPQKAISTLHRRSKAKMTLRYYLRHVPIVKKHIDAAPQSSRK